MSGKPNMVSPDFLSKAWNIDVSLAYKDLDQNNQLDCQGVKNIYPINFKQMTEI